MTAPQLRWYAVERQGRTAIVETASGSIVAWVEHLDGRLRGRRADWIGSTVDTIPQVISTVAEWADGTADTVTGTRA